MTFFVDSHGHRITKAGKKSIGNSPWEFINDNKQESPYKCCDLPFHLNGKLNIEDWDELVASFEPNFYPWFAVERTK